MVAVEQKKERDKTPQETAAAAAQTETKTPAIDPCKKTTGEKYYGILKFGVAEAVIVGATAITAYWSMHGKRTPWNVFRHFQEGAKGFFSFLPEMGKEGSELRKNMGIVNKVAMGTTATFHGGNLFAPLMKWFDTKKIDIVDYFNDKFGKDGEVKIGHEHVKNEPRQTWGDVIKGRLMGWGVVFASLSSVIFLLPKSTKNNKPHFGNFEEWVARKIAGFTKDGKELSKISVYDVPRVEDLRISHPHLAENKAYKFGKILAIDIFATAASILVWNAVSEFSARKRHKMAKGSAPEAPVLQDKPSITESIPTEKPHSESVKPRKASHIDSIISQRETMEAQPAQLGA